MARINIGRQTAMSEEGIVVFLIGMRVNNILKVHRWLPVFLAMGKMLPELYKNPSLGLKSHQMWFSRTLILVQYWENIEKLLDYAQARESQHLPAWKAFNRLASKTNSVGIWHETYIVDPGKIENMYVNMPTFGFGKVAQLKQAKGRLNSASGRLTR